MSTQPQVPASLRSATEAALPADGLEMPVPVRWMPALFRHTRVDARLYRADVLARACADRLAARGLGVEAWLADLDASAAEAWAMAGALEAACWCLPEVADLDVASALGAWRQCRPRTPLSGPGAADARVWLPACPDATQALRLNQWLASAQPALPWLVTCSPDATGQAVVDGAPGSAPITWRAHRVLHEPMHGAFDLIVAPALLAGVQPHVQRRLLAQWARLLDGGAALPGQAAREPGLLWVGVGAACNLALSQGWRRAGPGPLLRPPSVAQGDVEASVTWAGPADLPPGGPAEGREVREVREVREARAGTATAATAAPWRAWQPGAAQAASPDVPVLKTEQLLMALAREALVLRYEPQRSMAQGRRVAMAAVLTLPDSGRRLPETEAAWRAARHPAHTGLLSQWALQLACREAGRWAKVGRGEALDLQVPVVASQLQQVGWVDQLCQTLEHAGMAPERLTLCLGARSLVQPSAALLRALVDIRRLGVRIAVTRLKAGDALLDRLPALPIDELRIDSRLLDQVPGEALAEATVRRIAALGREHGWRVVADGVARESQRRWLAALHCQAYQGALAGAPVAAGSSIAPGAMA